MSFPSSNKRYCVFIEALSALKRLTGQAQSAGAGRRNLRRLHPGDQTDEVSNAAIVNRLSKNTITLTKSRTLGPLCGSS